MSLVTIDPTKVRPLLGSNVSLEKSGYAAGSIREIVYKDANNEIQKAASEFTGQVGMVVGIGRVLAPQSGTFGIGEGITVCWEGRIAIDDPEINWDPTAKYFLSDTPGRMADVAGTTTRYIGSPIGSRIFYFNGTKVE